MDDATYDRVYDKLMEAQSMMDEALIHLNKIKHENLDVEIGQAVLRLREAIYWVNEPTGEM